MVHQHGLSPPDTQSHMGCSPQIRTLLILTGSRLDLVSEPDFKLAALRLELAQPSLLPEAQEP